MNTPALFREDVEISGHIIDSLLLPKILDVITSASGSFEIKKVSIGHARNDPSYALVEVRAASRELLDEILEAIFDHGAQAVHQQNCRLTPADQDGAFPEGFYSTTNQKTEVLLEDQWVEVQRQEMDCGIVVEPAAGTASCLPMCEVRRGQQVVIGHLGVRVTPYQRQSAAADSFEFMNSSVSTEKPKGVAIRQIAAEMHRVRQAGGKILLVGGPAIVHTGSGEHLSEIIRLGYVQHLFAGNALATHDIEQSLFGTSLGVRLDCGDIVDAGHEHHLRAINRIRRCGGIAEAVRSGVLTSGVMYECVQGGVDFVLAGSIRDDGPLPDVITDVLEAQTAMRQRVHRGEIQFCLMIATALHSIAVGNLLPAWVKVVCVDINPSTVIKLSDRGSFQTMGLVTDVEPFLRSLLQELKQASGSSRAPASAG